MPAEVGRDDRPVRGERRDRGPGRRLVDAVGEAVGQHEGRPVGRTRDVHPGQGHVIIGDALAAQGVDVDRRRILLEAPIRSLGTHEVRVRLHADVVATLNVKVVAEDKVSDAAEPVVEAEPETPVE